MMSLFPAFSGETDNSNCEIANSPHESFQADWLTNTSFTPVEKAAEVIVIDSPPVIDICDDSGSPIDLLKPSSSKSLHRHHKKKKKKSSKSHKHRKERDCVILEDTSFPNDPHAKYYEDKNRQVGNLSVPTLYRPAIPQYCHKYVRPVGKKYYFGSLLVPYGKIVRYFKAFISNEEGKMREGDEEEDEQDDPGKSDPAREVTPYLYMTGRLEKEVQHATGSFNRKLTENPHDIRAWLEFLRFQDRASELQFQGGRSRRALVQRKLDILAKALQENPGSWLLLREKADLEQILYPPDELELRMAKEVGEARSIGPWLAFLKVLQGRASTTEVGINYGKAMETARREGRAFRRRTGKSPVIYDEQIVDLLLSCGMYMRQAGLWERMWTLLRMYLELNVKTLGSAEEKKPENVLDVGVQPSDDEFEELEVEVLKSGLPLSEIWLRVEGLRQSVRWLPLIPSGKNEAEGDLQRYVFPEDVSELVQPLASVGISSSGIFTRLASTALLLLKVPLLPCRDTALRRHGLPSWTCDTPEIPLTAVFSTGPWDWGKKALPLDLLGELIAGGGGPQYFLPRPGRDSYLKSIQKLFMTFTEVTGSTLEQQCFGVWWLRFERWLLMLEGYSSHSANFSIPQKRKKSLRSTLKEFLSRSKNRSSLALYREYALIEVALGKTESAIHTLCTAANLGGYPVVGVNDRAELCSVYRTLAEIILKEEVDKISSESKKRPVSLSGAVADKQVTTKNDRIFKDQCDIASKSDHHSPSVSGESSNIVELVNLDSDCEIIAANDDCNARCSDDMPVKRTKMTPKTVKQKSETNLKDIILVNLEESNSADTTCEEPDAYFPESLEASSNCGNLSNSTNGNVGNSERTIASEGRTSCEKDVECESIDPPANSEKGFPQVVDGVETANVINLSVVHIGVDNIVKKKSRWDMREAPIGAGGRRPRWTAASVFMGSMFAKESVKSGSNLLLCGAEGENEEQSGSQRTTPCETEGESTNSSAKRKRKHLDDLKSKPCSSTSSEQKVITLLTCLGLGKPLTSLEKVSEKSEIDSSLQRFKLIAEETLKDEAGSCTSPELHERGCTCRNERGEGGGGIECFQSYFVVEWVSCRAWLLALVDSVWAAGAAFEEAICKCVKVSIEEMEEVEESVSEESESNRTTETDGTRGGRYNPDLVRARNIREALYEGYITMLLSRRWSHEARSGLNNILADVIRRALSEFPENVHFASAVAITENDVGCGGSPWWSVTSYFEGGLGRAGGCRSTIFGKVFLVLLAEQRRIRAEEGRKDAYNTLNLGGPFVEDTSSTNRLRNVLHRLIADPGTKYCPLLWRLYLRFVGGVEGMEKCKGVMYRGLQECPWVKAFYLDAARLLPEENSQIQDLITEKELRLHISLEELEILRT